LLSVWIDLPFFEICFEKYFYEIENGPWNIPDLISFLEEVFSLKRSFKDFEIISSAGDNRRFLVGASPVETHNEKLLILSIEESPSLNGMDYRLAIEKLIANISNRFINIGTDSVEIELKKALEDTGSFLGADRCYIYLYSDDLKRIKQGYEWYDTKDKKVSEQIENLPVDPFSWSINKFKNTDYVHVPSVEKLPEEAKGEREICSALGIKSFLSIPLYFNKKLKGFFGCDTERGEKCWKEEDIRLLRLAGEIFVNAIERRNAEEDLRAREGESFRLSHLASIGELAAGVAHEINSPINGIINCAEILQDKSGKDTVEYEIAGKIIKGVESISYIVRSLLSFAREDDEEKVFVNLYEILQEALTIIRRILVKDNIKLEVNLSNGLPQIAGHPQKLQQVFLNILSNARYALNQKYPGKHEDKILEVTGEEVVIDGKSFIRLVFYDSGIGIPPEIINKIITPFFSTKPRGKGTGLGLSISHGIINSHKGILRFESRKGEFAKAIVELPVMEKGEIL